MGRTAAHRRFSPSQLALLKVAIVLGAGVIVGAALGLLLMGTIHSIMEINAKSIHFGKQPSTAAKTVSEKRSVEAKQPAAKAANGGGIVEKISYKIHTLATSNGSPYQNYQMRIAFGTYQLMTQMEGGDRHVAFTRILHRTKPDELMDEIPTFRAKPLQSACDVYCEYPVSDRGNAVRQFFDAAEADPSLLKAPWVYVIESDYVFMKPLDLPPPGSKPSDPQAWGFPFEYIRPAAHPALMAMLWPEGKAGDIPNTGPAPLLMSAANWKKVAPGWERLSAVIEADEEIKAKLGWVREMYGFSAALASAGVATDLTPVGRNKFIAQLPNDAGLGDAHAFHYTLCTIYKTIVGEEDVWKYDKRFHVAAEEALKVPAIPELPEFQPGKWKFIEGQPVTADKHAAIVMMVGQMNKAIATLKDLRTSRR